MTEKVKFRRNAEALGSESGRAGEFRDIQVLVVAKTETAPREVERALKRPMT